MQLVLQLNAGGPLMFEVDHLPSSDTSYPRGTTCGNTSSPGGLPMVTYACGPGGPPVGGMPHFWMAAKYIPSVKEGLSWLSSWH